MTRWKSEMIISFDSASVPKFDSQKPFKVWYRKWLDFCIGKRWESLYETGARGVNRMPVINDKSETGVRNNEVRDSDHRIVRSALLGAFDEALRESYEDENAYPSALCIVKDLERRCDTESRFRAQRILHQVLGLECKDINQLQDCFETFRRMVSQIKSTDGLFRLNRDTEVYLLTNAIKVESLKELVEDIKSMDDMTADRAIEMLSVRVELLKSETGSLTEAAVVTEAKAMAAKVKRIDNCQGWGTGVHRVDYCLGDQLIVNIWNLDSFTGFKSSLAKRDLLVSSESCESDTSEVANPVAAQTAEIASCDVDIRNNIFLLLTDPGGGQSTFGGKHRKRCSPMRITALCALRRSRASVEIWTD